MAEINIKKPVVVYASLPFKKYRWISYVSFIQVGFLVVNLWFLPTSRLVAERNEALANRVIKKKKSDDLTNNQNSSSDEWEDELVINPDYDPATVFERFKRLDYKELFTIRNVINNITERPLISLGLVASSVLISSSFWIYARRTLHMITLLPNERVRLSFFSPMGKPPSIELPLRDISCVQSRQSKHNYSILKLRGRLGFHLVHKAEGQFLEPKLYDKYLGYERSWAKKS